MKARAVYALRLLFAALVFPVILTIWIFCYLCEATHASWSIAKSCSFEIIHNFKRIRRMRRSFR